MEPYKYVCKYLDALHSGNWEKAEEYLACARKGIEVVIPDPNVIGPNVSLYVNVCSYLDALHSGKWELAEKYLACARASYLLSGLPLLTNEDEPILTNLDEEILV